MYLPKVNAKGNLLLMISRQMEVFMQVVESKSFNQAAKELLITPASVMKHMNNLENELDVTLFNRNSQGITLTSAGKSFYKDSKKIADFAQEAVTRAQNIEKNEGINIRIGSSLLDPSSVFTKLWHPYQIKYPQYKFDIVPFEDNHKKILSVFSKLGEKIDIIIGSFNSNSMHQHASYLPLGNYEYCIAVPKSHPLASKKVLSLNDLHNETLMMVKYGDSPVIDKFHDMLSQKHPEIEVKGTEYYYDINTFNKCEQTGTLLLTLDEWENVHPGLVTIPLDQNYKISYGIIYAKHPSEKVKKFIKIVKDEGSLNCKK